MEDGGGQIIYLIIVAAIFILQAIFGKKKKQGGMPRQPKQEYEQETEEKRSFEEILEDVFNEQKKQQKTYAPEKQQPLPTTKPVKPVDADRYKKRTKLKREEKPAGEKKYVNEYQKHLEEQRVESRKKFVSIDPLEVIDTSEDFLDDDLDFSNMNMRKAIVYQAILERRWDK